MRTFQLLPAACWLALAIGSALAQFSPNVSVYANGFDNPRGLKFGPDGKLYVAEAGTGGMLRRLRKEAAKRDELIARERAKFEAERALAGPVEMPRERRRRRAEEAAE